MKGDGFPRESLYKRGLNSGASELYSIVERREQNKEHEAEMLLEKFAEMSNNDVDRQLVLYSIHCLSKEYTYPEVLSILNKVQFLGKGNKAITFCSCYALLYFDNDDISSFQCEFSALLTLFLIDKNSLIVSTAKSVFEKMATSDMKEYLSEKITQMDGDTHLITYINNFDRREEHYAN